MSKIILHMGTHKTATTYLQELFAANRALLGEHGFVYPTVGKFHGHHMLLTEWVSMAPSYTPKGGTQVVWDFLINSYAHTDQTVIISSEEFSRAYPERVDMAQLRDRLSAFDEVEIICFLRDQKSFLQAIYLEISKSRSPEPLPEMLRIAKEDFTADGLWLDYNLLYDHFRTGFGADEIKLIPFDRAVKHTGGMLGCFLDLIGCDIEQDTFIGKDIAVNKSSDPLSMWAANVIAAPQPAKRKLSDFVCKQMEEFYGTGKSSTIFTRAEIKALADIFNPLNETLAKRISDHQPHFIPPKITINDAQIHRGQMDGQFWIRLLRALYRKPL